jgi:hypothetical protein
MLADFSYPVITNVTMTNFVLNNVTSTPFSITQCTTFSGTVGNCDSSLFLIEDLTMENATGTFVADPIADLECSADAPCQNISLVNFDLVRDSEIFPVKMMERANLIGTCRTRRQRAQQGVDTNAMPWGLKRGLPAHRLKFGYITK